MLEVTNIRNGAILNHARGTETDDYLEIKVEGIADPQADCQSQRRGCGACGPLFLGTGPPDSKDQ